MQIEQITPSQINSYASIPISFWVRSVFEIDPGASGLEGFLLKEIPVQPPYLKDYDAQESPPDWARQFDITRWGLFLGTDGQTPIAGAAVAINSPEVNMLENRKDLAVLWDIRVHPDWRGKGLGKAMFLKAVAWAKSQGCRQLKIETQNVNVPACQFYQALGCELGMIHRYGYAGIPEVAHEAMLFWYYQLE